MAASKMVYKSYGFNVNTYACAFNSYNEKVTSFSEQYYGSIRNGIGVNSLPVKNRVYHCMAGIEAINHLETMNGDEDVWIVGIWHDVNPRKFKENMERVKQLDVEVKTVRGVYGSR
jgi:hypothetical protein